MIAVGLSRQASALRLLETSRISHHLADQLLVRRILLHTQDLDSAVPEMAGFLPSVRAEPVRLRRGSLPDLEMEQVTAEVSWQLRGRPRSVRLETGFARRPGS